MRKSIKRISKRTVSIILSVMMIVSMMLVGMVTTNAVNNVKGGLIYFDNSLTNWSGGVIQFVIGHNTYSRTYVMSKVPDTNLYFVNIQTYDNYTWNDATYYAVIITSEKWGDGSWGSSNIQNATHETGIYTSTYELKKDNYYLITTNSGSDGTGITIGSQSSYTSMNSTDKIITQVKSGSSYQNATSALAKLSITTYQLNGNNTTKHETVSAKATSVTNYAARTTEVNLSVSEIVSGYEFVGWYNSSGTLVGTNQSYKYTATADNDNITEYYARFQSTSVSGITAVAKYSTNGTNFSEGTTGGTATLTGNGTVSSSGATVTATPNEGYHFLEWESSGSGTFESATSAQTVFYPKADGEKAYAKFVKTSEVSYDTPQNGSITVSNQSGTDLKETRAGDTVTVKVTANQGYLVGGITVTPTVSFSGSNGTYTFTMPGNDVNVQANIVERAPASISVSSNDDALGTASFDSTKTYYIGDQMNITATATGSGAFGYWTLSGAEIVSTSTSGSVTTTTIRIIASNVSAKANFSEKAYNLYYNKGTTLMQKTESGVYVSTITVANGADNDVNSEKFTIQRISDSKYANSGSEGTAYWIKNNARVQVSSWSSSLSKYYFNNSGSAKYVVYDPVNDQVYLAENPDGTNTPVIYVKDGTVRDEWDTTKSYGKSKLADNPNLTNKDEHEHYIIYNSSIGTTIEILTDVDDTKTKEGYYVFGYSVNGILVEASRKNEGDLYAAHYTLRYEDSYHGTFEITPIYYNTYIEENDDYVPFYANATEVKNNWQNTLAVDAYCYVGGNSATSEHLMGGYPGQLMYLQDGFYRFKVPKYRYTWNDTTKTYVADTTSPISGITINNYMWDKNHAAIYGTSTNYQSYDYSDMVELINNTDLNVKAIRFDFKYETDHDNKTILSSNQWNPSTSVSDIASRSDLNEFEEFVDYYNDDTDVLGYKVDEETSDKIYIVSIGSINTNGTDTGSTKVNNKNVSSFKTKGEWATIWYVYKVASGSTTGNLVAYGTPADFLDSNTTAFKAYEEAMTSNGVYQPLTTKISFANEIKSSGGVRSDGRWYYSRVGETYTSSVSIAYKKNGETSYTDDTNTNTENTGFIGLNSNGTTATLDGATTATYNTVDGFARLSIRLAKGWTFDGWYIGDRLVSQDLNYDMLMDNTYNIVARVREIPVGSIELSHTKYEGQSPAPAAHSGTGDYYISVELRDKNTKAVKTKITDSSEKVELESVTNNDEIVISLKTVCHGDNTFYAWYEYDNGSYFEIANESIEDDYRDETGTCILKEFILDCDSLFDVKGNLALTSLQFYSDIVKQDAFCDITYWYVDRFGDGSLVSYTAEKVVLSLDEITNNDRKPSEETITKNAPNIDTMYVDTKWYLIDNMWSAGKGYATVYATQTDKVCKVVAPEMVDDTFIYDSESGDYLYDASVNVAFNTFFADDEGNFKLTAPRTFEGKDFVHWEVYKLDQNGDLIPKPGTDGEYELVTILTDRTFTLRIMSDYKLVPKYGNTASTITANISTPVLNREVKGDSNSPIDKLYVDFLVAFTSTDVPVFKENIPEESGFTVECGVIVDRNNTLKLSAEHRTEIVAAANIKNVADPTETYLLKYKDSFKADYSKISEVAFDSQYGDKAKVAYTDTKGNEHRLSKYVFDNDQLTNKNRIDKVLTYTNNEDNQNYIFAAYSYVIIRNIETGETIKAITPNVDAQFYNLCYIGNKDYVESKA